MKIAVLIDTWFPFVGGGQINAYEISKRIAKKGHQVEIITRNGGNDNLKIVKNLKTIKLGHFTSRNELSRLNYLFGASIRVLKGDYDLVVAHAFLPGLVAKLFIVFKKKPAVLVVHGTSINSNLNKGFKAQLEKFLLTKIRYSAQITVSRDFLKIKNVNKNIVYIPNGVDQIFLKQSKPTRRIKNALLFVGRLHPQKNLINLIESIKILRDKKFPVSLTIIGEGPQKKEIKRLINKYKLQKRIMLEGKKNKEELLKYYYSSSALVLPSIYEGQALTLLEAWACKLPVIVTKTGDNPYLVKEGVNGFFIKRKNEAKSIAEAVETAILNRNLSKIGANGYNFATKNFSWNSSAIKTSKLYAEITKA